MNIDWENLTVKKAKRLRGAANRNLKRAAEKFQADEITEEEFLAVDKVDEDLLVFIHCGIKPE